MTEFQVCPQKDCDKAVLQEDSTANVRKKIFRCIFCNRKYKKVEDKLVEIKIPSRMIGL